jgi:hypothetical protein
MAYVECGLVYFMKKYIVRSELSLEMPKSESDAAKCLQLSKLYVRFPCYSERDRFHGIALMIVRIDLTGRPVKQGCWRLPSILQD